MNRDTLASRIAAFIDARKDGGRDDHALDALLEDIGRYQRTRLAPLQRLEQARGETGLALPTDIFRFARVATFPEAEDIRVFRTSGTTDASRGAHPFRDLSLYDLAARTAAKFALFPDVSRISMIVLAPHEKDAPDSSLSYMLARFSAWFGEGSARHVVRDGALDARALVTALEDAERHGRPVAVLGTSFAFVHAIDALGGRCFSLASGSRAMQTGGTKGRSREVSADELRGQISALLSIPQTHVVSEYGMTELSSQMYETSLRDAWLGRPEAPRRYWVPGWVRVTPVDPESLRPVREGQVGILRIDDAANLDACAAIQTSDLATKVGDAITLLGRDPRAVPRGCSLAMEDALSVRR